MTITDPMTKPGNSPNGVSRRADRRPPTLPTDRREEKVRGGRGGRIMITITMAAMAMTIAYPSLPRGDCQSINLASVRISPPLQRQCRTPTSPSDLQISGQIPGNPGLPYQLQDVQKTSNPKANGSPYSVTVAADDAAARDRGKGSLAAPESVGKSNERKYRIIISRHCPRFPKRPCIRPSPTPDGVEKEGRPCWAGNLK